MYCVPVAQPGPTEAIFSRTVKIQKSASGELSGGSCRTITAYDVVRQLKVEFGHWTSVTCSFKIFNSSHSCAVTADNELACRSGTVLRSLHMYVQSLDFFLWDCQFDRHLGDIGGRLYIVPKPSPNAGTDPDRPSGDEQSGLFINMASAIY